MDDYCGFYINAHISTLLCQTFRDLLQPGQHLGQFLLPLGQLASTRKVYSEQSHDGVDDLTTGRSRQGGD